MTIPLTDATAIVGVGATEYYRRGTSLPATPMQLAGQATHRALTDAGLTVRDIDGLAMFSGGINAATFAETLGIPELSYTATLPGGGGGSAGSIGLAASAIVSGLATVVVCVMVLQQAGYRLGQAGGANSPYALKFDADTDFVVPYGWISPGQKYAIAAQRHMHLYGTTREHFAEVAISTRLNASRRETATLRDPITLDDYMSSRMISDPLCLFDYCLESDGAVAVLVTSAERAADLRQTPVLIHAAAFGGEGPKSSQLAWVNSPDDYFVSGYSEAVGRQLYRHSDIAPADIDVAELYDHFGPTVLFQLEDYGFCPRGESGNFVSDGAIRWPDGRLPVNTHGGHLSEAYIMGMTHIREAVEQLRGNAVNQVAGARTALVSGGPASIPMSAAILRTEAS